MRRLVVVLAGALVLVPLAPLVRAAPPAAAQKYALVIGINDYQAPTKDTIGSVGDALDMREALLRNGWPDGNIRMLLDGAATGTAMREGMRWLASKSGADTFTVFHYSGHTKQMDTVPDAEGWDEFLWSATNEFISDNELTDAMKAVQGRLWANIVNCEAAGFDDGFSGPDKLFTAASREDQKGYEEPGWNRSVFSGLMVREGILKGQADANKDGAASLDEAFAYAERVAPTMTANAKPYGPQNPVRRGGGGGGGEWFLSPPPAARATDLAPVESFPAVQGVLDQVHTVLPAPPPGTPEPPRPSQLPPLPAEQLPITSSLLPK